MIKCEWHNYPIPGCERIAKYFCKSLVKESIGIKPSHRAFCEECFNRISSYIGRDLEVVSYDEWKILRPEMENFE